jgi:hypothetical protein
MSELDLIPVRYANSRHKRRWTVVFAALYAVVALCLFSFRIYLDRSIGSSQALIENLEVETMRLEGQRREWDALAAERAELEQRLSVLEGLRGGIAAKDMFSVVDSALDEEIWFRSWSFRRAGEIVDKEPNAVETGYFIVLPKEAPNDPERAWRLETHMEIGAESEDHTSLARFVRLLSERPEVENARILNTRREGNGADENDRIGFEIAVLVRSQL